MFRFTLDELNKLKAHTDLSHELEGTKRQPLTEDLLNQLVSRFVFLVQVCPDYEDNAIFEQPTMSACGCMGPQDGETFCNCTMVQLRYAYRYDLALKLVELGIVQAYDKEKWAHAKLVETIANVKYQKEQEEALAERRRIFDIINSDGRVVQIK